jgi:hypothetical protein
LPLLTAQWWYYYIVIDDFFNFYSGGRWVDEIKMEFREIGWGGMD